MAEEVYILSLWAGEEKLDLLVEKGAVATRKMLGGVVGRWGAGLRGRDPGGASPPHGSGPSPALLSIGEDSSVFSFSQMIECPTEGKTTSS